MNNKILSFKIYRFQLLPLSNNEQQLEIFENNKLSNEEIKAKKNIFFAQALDSLIDSTTNPIVLHDKKDSFYLYKNSAEKDNSNYNRL